jgi:hypothetical protein
MATTIRSILHRPVTAVAISVLGLLPLLLVAGCQEDDCVACVAPPPVAPTNVHSASGDGFITVYWDDDPEIYSDDITGYRVWSRYFEPGDELDPAREFYLIGEIAVGQNQDVATGRYHFIDDEVENAVDYEYAVSTVARSGESYLSFELIIDTPLPMSESPLTLFDVDGPSSHLSGLDLSLAAEHGAYEGNGAAGVVDGAAVGTSADVVLRYDAAGVPWLASTRPEVRLQDYGTFLDLDGDLYFEGVSWAPEFGWSASGLAELIPGHIYVVEIVDENAIGDVHYAKIGAVSADGAQRSARVMWAYQLVNGLPELAAPEHRRVDAQRGEAISL